jgi:hypothetical protein
MSSIKWKSALSPSPFDLQKEFSLALEWMIEHMKKVQKEAPDWHVGYYFSATDLERRVRAAAQEKLDRKETGYYGMDSYGGVKISGLNGIPLLQHCRTFLTAQVRVGVLRADQPSAYRTISNLRFRPIDWPLTEAEEKEKRTPEEEKRRKRNLVHFDPDKILDPKKKEAMPLCQKTKKENEKKNPHHSKYRSNSYYRNPWRIRTTEVVTQVSCKVYLRHLRTAGHPLAPELAMGTDPLIVADWLEEHGKDEEASKLRLLYKKKED